MRMSELAELAKIFGRSFQIPGHSAEPLQRGADWTSRIAIENGVTRNHGSRYAAEV